MSPAIEKKEGPQKDKTGKNNGNEELQTESPISEKDEVKAAERRTAKLHKKASEKSTKKSSD